MLEEIPMKFTKAQQAVINQTAGFAYVSAHPGSGLSKVLRAIKQRSPNTLFLDCNYINKKAPNAFYIDDYVASIKRVETSKIPQKTLDLYAERKGIDIESFRKSYHEYCHEGQCSNSKHHRYVEDCIQVYRRKKSYKRYDKHVEAFANIDCVVVDNFHNAKDYHLTFLATIKPHVKRLIIGGDENRTIYYAYHDARMAFIETAKKFELTQSFTVSKEMIPVLIPLANKRTMTSKLTIGNIKHIRCATPEVQYDYLIKHIQSLLESGEDPSTIAVVGRLKSSIVPVCGALKDAGIITTKAFVKNKVSDSIVGTLNAMIVCIQHLIEGHAITSSTLRDVLSMFCLKIEDEQKLIDDVIKRGITQLKLPRKVDRSKSDAMLKVQKAIVQASSLKPEKGIMLVVDALKTVANLFSDDAKNMMAIISRLMVEYRKFNHWHEISTSDFDYKKGVVITTFHRLINKRFEHVFVVDCVDGIVPYTKYKNAHCLENEQGLFYTVLTRSSHVTVLKSSFTEKSFVNGKVQNYTHKNKSRFLQKVNFQKG